jgi:hypothetical protein
MRPMTDKLQYVFIYSVGVCMLGRLGIPLKQAIGYYPKLAEVFSHRKLIGTSGPSAFKLTKLKEALKMIIHEATGDENAQMIDIQSDTNKCKTCD